MIDKNHLIVSYLSNFVTEERRNRIEKILSQRTRYISVLLENIYQSQNASAVLRTCDCFGIQDLHIIENNNVYNINPMVVKGADQWVNIIKYNQFENNSPVAVNRLKSEGYRIIATTLHEDSIKLPDFDINKGKCVIVFGNENQGVSGHILQEADEYLKIPMYGFSQSLNISVSAGIIIHHLVEKLKNSSVEWHLSPEEKNILLKTWLENSVKHPDMLINRWMDENKK